MFCSLIGISPCDIILQDIDNRVVKNLLQALNNRFDVGSLDMVKAEFDYVLGILDNMIFDYEDREDRVLSKKLSVASMALFGSEEEKNNARNRLMAAKKSFTGNMVVDGKTIAVSSEAAKAILIKLYEGRERLKMIRNSISGGSFSDEVFFGHPLTWWANSRSHTWLSVYVTSRIELQDNISHLRRDAENLLSYVTDDKDSEMLEVHAPTMKEITSRYAQLSGGNEMTLSEKELACQLIDTLSMRELTSMGSAIVANLVSTFVHCLIASKQYDGLVAERMEDCGLFFMNPVRAEFMLSCLSDLTLIPERRITLKNIKSGDSYETILGAIIAACDNDLTPIGVKLSRGGS